MRGREGEFEAADRLLGEPSRGACMPAERPERTERLQVILTRDEISAIDDFRFENRLPSRAAAVRELLRRGLFSSTGHVS